MLQGCAELYSCKQLQNKTGKMFVCGSKGDSGGGLMPLSNPHVEAARRSSPTENKINMVSVQCLKGQV